MTTEELRPIPGYPNYFADIFGGIWSTQRAVGYRQGTLHKLSPFPKGENNCLRVSIVLPDRKYVHRSAQKLWRLAYPTIAVEKKLREVKVKPVCKDPDCNNQSITRGFCGRHYMRLRRHSTAQHEHW